MTTKLATATQNALANQIAALTDAGTGPGTLKVYAGTMPATANDPITGTLLATFTLTDPAMAAAAAGVAAYDFDPDLSATVQANGTATHFRVADSNGVTVYDGDVSTSGAALTFANVNWTSGGTVTLTSGTVTAPAS